MKQVIVFREDLKLPWGKACVQAAHAAVEAAYNSSQGKIALWLAEGAKKVVVKVKDLKELQALQRKAKASKLVASLIKDAGKTVVKPGTVTALGIGPDDDVKIDKVTKDLKLV